MVNFRTVPLWIAVAAISVVLIAVAAVFALAVSIWVILQAAAPIARALGQTGMNVATRFMGLVLAAVAIEFMAGGLIEIFPGWVAGAVTGTAAGGGA